MHIWVNLHSKEEDLFGLCEHSNFACDFAFTQISLKSCSHDEVVTVINLSQSTVVCNLDFSVKQFNS